MERVEFRASSHFAKHVGQAQLGRINLNQSYAAGQKMRAALLHMPNTAGHERSAAVNFPARGAPGSGAFA